jgi:hypothetical protein
MLSAPKLLDLYFAERTRYAANAKPRLAQIAERHPVDVRCRMLVEHDGRGVEPGAGAHHGSIVAGEDLSELGGYGPVGEGALHRHTNLPRMVGSLFDERRHRAGSRRSEDKTAAHLAWT